jgi:hypothetical protein
MISTRNKSGQKLTMLWAFFLTLSIFTVTVRAQSGAPVSGAQDANPPPPKKGFMSGLGDSIKNAMAKKVIWAYWDNATDAKRYYCLYNQKTGDKVPDAVAGQLAMYPDGSFTVNQPQGRTVSVSLLAYKCDKLERDNKLTIVGYPSTVKVIDKLGLRNVLPEYDQDQSVKQQYPHIAITVLSSPPDWAKTGVIAEDGIYLGCWTLKARVWDSATQSRSIDPFQFCSPQDAGEVKFGLTAKWPERASTDVKDLTGIKRTDGPQPPSSVIPADRDTAGLALKDGSPNWPSLVADRNYFATPLFQVFGELRYELGARDGGDSSHDLRVWLVSVAQ